jgi:hypothetical protein
LRLVEKAAARFALFAVPFISSLQKEKIQADILALNIDYSALHMRCIDLLRNIHSTLHLDFVKFLQEPNYLGKESQLPLLVGYLFPQSLLGVLRLRKIRKLVAWC